MIPTSHRAVTLVLAVALGGSAPTVPGPGRAAEPGRLGIELNKAESADDGCRALFVFDNRTGRELSRFRVDLILFDREGVYKKQLMLDLAPLYADKKTVASFLLAGAPCAEIGSILVNDIPQCTDGVGHGVNCVDLLKVDSRADIPLEK